MYSGREMVDEYRLSLGRFKTSDNLDLKSSRARGLAASSRGATPLARALLTGRVPVESRCRVMPPSYANKRPGGPSGSSSQQAKKPMQGRPPRDEDEDDDADMDEMIEDEEEMMMEEMLASAGAPPEDSGPVALLGSKDMAQFEREWRRPPLPTLDPATDSITFQQIEADYSVHNVPTDFARGSTESKAAVIRLFGVTRAGNSVVAHVHGFRPYFYVRAPPGFGQADVAPFQQALAAKLKGAVPAKDQQSACVLKVDAVQRQSIMNYNFKTMQPFLRVVVSLPTMVSTARRLLENGLSLPRMGSVQYDTFESNCAFVLRYMVDRDIVGCNWLTIPEKAWKARGGNSSGEAPGSGEAGSGLSGLTEPSSGSGEQGST